jgi:hypothetical protein
MCLSCHYGMVRPQVVDGGDDLQLRRVPVNILNKKLQTTNKGWSYLGGWVRGQTTPHIKKK